MRTDARLFTPGPVRMAPEILELATRRLPYNRTADFSALTRELVAGLARLFGTSGEVVILTASGTGAMEAAVQNLLGARDRVLVVNGGVFGQRWVDLCALHGVAFEEWRLPWTEPLDPEAAEARLASGRFTAVLATAHETSTGVLHDVRALGEAAYRHGVFLLVDAISTIGADPFHMDAWHVGAAVLSSQKALALPPGLSFVALSGPAMRRLAETRPRTLYFRLEDYLRNQERGQSPFTPAVGLYVMLQARLRQIAALGMDAMVAQHAGRAAYFRERLAGLPLSVFPSRPSNALTALSVTAPLNARRLVGALASRHGMVVAPNGGELEAEVFRVAHLGEQTEDDLDALLVALKDVTQQ